MLPSVGGNPVTKSREMTDLIPGTHRMSGLVLAHLLNGRPPEPLFDDEACSLYSRMAGQEGGMSPVDHLRKERGRN